MQNFYLAKKLRSQLRFFLAVVFILSTLGLIFIYSSSCVYSFEKFGSSFYYVKKQFFGLFLGLLAFFVLSHFPLRIIKKYSFLLFLGSMFLVFLTLIPGLGVKINGSSRWLRLPGFVFQPSEFLKITLFLYLSKILEKRRLKDFNFFSSYLPLLFIVGSSMLLLLIQPDFGTAVTIFLTFFSIIFLFFMNWKYILATLLSAIPAFLFLIFLKPYRIKRLFVYLNPWQDPQGAGFQVIQSLIAIGNGGLAGLGISKSKQKFFYLPMQHTDFIFSIIAEEIGFIGSTLLVTMFMFLFILGMRMAYSLQSFYSKLIVLSFTILLTLQFLINIGVASGLLPTKGIGLPFVSFGSSCLLSSFIMVGLIANAVINDEVL